MATTLERQISTFSDTPALQQTRRHSIEVIDVDLLDDPSPVVGGAQQPPSYPVVRQMPESILVIDSSDDEDNELSQGQLSNQKALRNRLTLYRIQTTASFVTPSSCVFGVEQDSTRTQRSKALLYVHLTPQTPWAPNSFPSSRQAHRPAIRI